MHDVYSQKGEASCARSDLGRYRYRKVEALCSEGLPERLESSPSSFSFYDNFDSLAHSDLESAGCDSLDFFCHRDVRGEFFVNQEPTVMV